MTDKDALDICHSWGVALMGQIDGPHLRLLPLRFQGWAIYLAGARLFDDDRSPIPNSFEGRTLGEAVERARPRVHELLAEAE